MSPAGADIASSKRLVVKIGSSILVDEAKGEVRRDWLEALTRDVAHLHQGGCEVVLVSSGAIRLGRTYLKLANGPLKLEESQAAAATGQIQLAHAYQESLARHGDNDRLGARVAEMISADTLVLLSDIDGLYTGDPRSDKQAVHIPEIREITPEIEAMGGAAASTLS